MGRKIDMKKIEDVTKCQVTFSKRRSSMMKKANEIAVCCDVDVAFVAFSPSGRVSKFCNQKRIEEVLHRYVNLSPERRLNHMSNVQGKVDKLRQLRHINGDTSKLHYLDKQMENLELQIKKTGLELQILETDLRDYEIGAEQEPSFHQLSWCERNLKQSLQTVIARKLELVELESQSLKPFPTTFKQTEPVSPPNPRQMLMHLDPWISPYSAKVRESIFQDIVGQAKQPTTGASMSTLTQLPIQESPPPHIPPEQPLMIDPPIFDINNDQNNDLKQSMMMDQTLFNFLDQNNASAYNASSSNVVYSDAIQMSTQATELNIPDLGSTDITNTTTPNPNTGEMARSVYDEMGSGSEGMNSHFMSQVSQETEQVNVEGNTLILNANNNTTKNNNAVDDDDVYTINIDEIQTEFPPHDGNHLFEENNEDNPPWASNLPKSNAWEWEDMFLDENFNFQSLP